MATARDILIRAYRKAQVIARNQTPEDDLLASGLATMNDLLESWRDTGIDLGLDTLTLATECAISPGEIRALIYNLAVELATEEQVAVPPATAAIAASALSALAGRLIGMQPVRLDPALSRWRQS